MADLPHWSPFDGSTTYWVPRGLPGGVARWAGQVQQRIHGLVESEKKYYARVGKLGWEEGLGADFDRLSEAKRWVEEEVKTRLFDEWWAQSGPRR